MNSSHVGQESVQWKEEAHMMAMHSFAYAIGLGTLHQVLRRYGHIALGEKSRNAWGNYIISTLHSIVAAVGACSVFWSEQPYSGIFRDVSNFSKDVDTVHGFSPTLLAFLPFTLGYFAYDTVMMLLDEQLYGHVIMLHHLISLLVFPVSCLSRAGSFYVLCFLFAEVSTPLLNLVVYFLPEHGCDGLVRSLLGVLLILVFFLVRVLPCPAILFSLSSSWRYWQIVHPVVMTTAMLTIPLPTLFFCYWWGLLVHGAAKALLPSKAKGDKDD